MAIQAKVVLVGGVEVADAYVRTKAVTDISKNESGINANYSAEAFKDAATAEANGNPLPLVGAGIYGTIQNVESITGLTGNLANDAFGVLYADLKQKIVDLGWEADVSDIEDV